VKRLLIYICVLFVCSLQLWFWKKPVNAVSMGISPTLLNNENLLRGSYFEQKYIISRKDPSKDDYAKIEIIGEEITNWIEIDPGNEFVLPKGETSVEFKVSVSIPDDAKYQKYEGKIRILISQENEGQVTIQQGVDLVVDLNVSDIEYSKLQVYNLKINDFKKGENLILSSNIKNLGNISASPDKIEINIKDTSSNDIKQISSSEIEAIDPFSEKEVLIDFGVIDIEEGTYVGDIIVYFNKEIIAEEKSIFNVLEGQEKLNFVQKIIKNYGKPVMIGGGVLLGLAFIFLILLLKKDKRNERKS